MRGVQPKYLYITGKATGRKAIRVVFTKCSRWIQSNNLRFYDCDFTMPKCMASLIVSAAVNLCRFFDIRRSECELYQTSVDEIDAQ
eukprot:2716095-Pleurochrysis_carterae.AAC.1